jgi:hypothetical protein
MSLQPVLHYLTSLSKGKMILWCYLFWYLTTIFNYFDPSPTIWLNALGLSTVIGLALVLSVNTQGFRNLDAWPTFRLFLMPFCVSSFSTLIKGHGFFVILPPYPMQRLVSLSICGGFILVVMGLKMLRKSRKTSQID